MGARIKTWANEPWRLLFPLGNIAIVVLYVAVRMLDIDRLVTTDEPFWLGRSANFYRALVDGDYAHTYQMAHPGVMTMWAGALAYWIHFPEYARLAVGNLDDAYSIETILRGMGQDPLEIMVAAKQVKIVVQAIFFVIALAFLRTIIGRGTTIVVGLLFAFSPMMSGFDSALHVDGLFATISFAAVIVITWASLRPSTPRLDESTYWHQSWPWILAGILSAMAILTRSTGVILAGAVGMALLIRVATELRSGNPLVGTIRRALVSGLTITGSTLLTIFLLLPALWVAPGDTISQLWAWSTEAAVDGHENPTFFRGIQYGDPGPTVYPVVLAWRTSPVEWLGVLLLIGLAWWGWKRREVLTPPGARLLLVSLAFAIAYIAAMSIGAKKFDRYILPAFPVITLLVAYGLMLGKRWLASRGGYWKRASVIALALLLMAQAASWNSVRPYRLDYYNPVLGGAQQARHVLQMGWGQGGDQVVDFLIDQAQHAPITVQASAVSSAFTYFLPDDSPVQFVNMGIDTPATWYETDYFVGGIQQTQRDMSQAYALLGEVDPIHTVEIGGVAYFEVFEVGNLPVPEPILSPTACNHTFGGEIKLLQISGGSDSVDFYFLNKPETTGETITLSITFVFEGGAEATEVATLEPAQPRTISKVTIPYRQGYPLDQASITIQAETESGILLASAPWLEEEEPYAATYSECVNRSIPGE